MGSVSVEDALAGLDQATVSDRFPHLLPESLYLLKVTKCDLVDAHRSGVTFVIETEVVQCDRPEEKPGSPRTVTITDLKGKHAKLKQGKLKSFLAEVGHLDPEAPTPAPHAATWIALAVRCVKEGMANGMPIYVRTGRTAIAEGSGKQYVPETFERYTPA